MKTFFKILTLAALACASPVAFADHGGGHSGGHSGSGHFSGGHHFSGSSGSRHFGHFRGHDHVFFDFGFGVPFYYGPGYCGPEYYARSPAYDSGYEVAVDVQAALARLGFYRGDIDGVVGPMTRNAIRQYQATHRLLVTGMIDQDLIDSLGLG